MRTTDARTKLLNAALGVIRTQGYAATTVDELCAAAGVTKGAFFHHFESKEDLAISAAQHGSLVTGELFRSGPYHRHADPLDRVLGYIDFRRDLVRGQVPEFTCLVDTMVQEAYHSSPAIRAACHDSIFGHSEDVARDIEEAKRKHVPSAPWTARSLALHVQAVLQGSFILAKADGEAKHALESIAHLRRYIELLFNQKEK